MFAEFELLYAQLFQHVPVSNEANEELKARLANLAHASCGIPNDLSDFHMQRDCLVAIRDLKSNPEIQICRSDKGSGMVILNKSDYVEKMAVILSNVLKFQHL